MTGSSARLAIEDALRLLGDAEAGPMSRRFETKNSTSSCWVSFLGHRFQEASRKGRLWIPGRDPRKIAEAHLLSDRGSAPAWRLTTIIGESFKLRVDEDLRVVDRINEFLTHTGRVSWPSCAKRVAVGGRSILKTWVPGRHLREIEPGERYKVLRKIGRRLAELHGEASDDSHLVCSADDYNTVLTPDGGVSFIDLEACHRGSRWVELAWSEELLCRSSEEKYALWEAYLQRSGIPRPSSEEWVSARLEFLRWLKFQIERSLYRRPEAVALRRDRDAVQFALDNGGRGRVFPDRPWSPV